MSVRMTPSTPAEFGEAQKFLNDVLGDQAVFIRPTPDDQTWPGGTVFDPETGLPMDPVVQASGTATASASATVGTYFGTYTPDEDVDALGILGASDGMVMVMAEDWRSEIEDSTHVEIRNVRYKIESWRPDGLTTTQRWLGWLKQG